MIGGAFRGTNLATAFLLGLRAPGRAGLPGRKDGDGLLAKTTLGLAAPLLKLGAQLAVFGSATLALLATGSDFLALALVVVNGVPLRPDVGAGEQDGRRTYGRRQTCRKIFLEAAMGSSSRP